MINASDLQSAYVDMYTELRNYIWSYPTVEAIASLEMAVYQKCPDLDLVRRCFYTLVQMIGNIKYEDEDMKKVFDAFSDIMNSDNSIYSKLSMVNEAGN